MRLLLAEADRGLLEEGGVIETRRFTAPRYSTPIWHLTGTLQIILLPKKLRDKLHQPRHKLLGNHLLQTRLTISP